jgi:hypothetical protein
MRAQKFKPIQAAQLSKLLHDKLLRRVDSVDASSCLNIVYGRTSKYLNTLTVKLYYASTGEELLDAMFLTESGLGYFPSDPRSNDYYVYTARRYLGHWAQGGFVIQRYYSTADININSNLRWVRPTL